MVKKKKEKRFCCLLQSKQAEIKKKANLNTYRANTLLHVNYKAELFKHLQGNNNPCLSREQCMAALIQTPEFTGPKLNV